MRSRLAEITRFTEENAWLDAGSRGWAANHWTEWPSVLHQALDRLEELPEATHLHVSSTVEAWSMATLAIWELSQELIHEGVHRVEDVGQEARHEIESAAVGLYAALGQAGRSLPGPWRRP